MSEFREYIASTKFLIGIEGSEDNKGPKVERGDVIRYNGHTAIIGGVEYPVRNLQSAIKARWLVSPEDLGLSGEPSRISAHIKMSGATPQQTAVVASSALTADEERDVGTIQSVRHAGSSHRTASFMDSQGEPVVGYSFKTKAGKEALETTVSVDKLSQNAIASIEAGVERMDKAQMFEEAHRRKMEREIEDLRRQLVAAQSQQVTRVAEREGIRFSGDNLSERAMDAVRAGDTARDISRDLWDGDVDATPVVARVTASAPSPEEDAAANKRAKIALARQMVPNFDWDLDMHWKSKMKELSTKGALFVCAAYMVENDTMRRRIAEAFPHLNLGE